MEIKQIHVEIIQFFFYFRFTNILTLNTGLSHYKQNINNFKIKSFAHLFIRQCYMKVYRCNDFTSMLILFTALEKSVQFDPQYSSNAGFRQFLLLGEMANLPFWPKNFLPTRSSSWKILRQIERTMDGFYLFGNSYQWSSGPCSLFVSMHL